MIGKAVPWRCTVVLTRTGPLRYELVNIITFARSSGHRVELAQSLLVFEVPLKRAQLPKPSRWAMIESIGVIKNWWGVVWASERAKGVVRILLWSYGSHGFSGRCKLVVFGVWIVRVLVGRVDRRTWCIIYDTFDIANMNNAFNYMWYFFVFFLPRVFFARPAHL